MDWKGETKRTQSIISTPSKTPSTALAIEELRMGGTGSIKSGRLDKLI